MIDFARSKEIFLRIYNSEELANRIDCYIEKHKVSVKFFLALCNKNRWEPALKQEPMMKLSLVYAFLPTVWDRYKDKGIPEEILLENQDTCLRIPMIGEIRSLNLSNSVAIVAYEAFRQDGFSHFRLEGKLTKYDWK